MNRRNHNHSALALTSLILSFISACSSAGDDDDDTRGNTQPLTCMAGTMQACACLGQSVMGMQSCNPTGNGYGACVGCPPPPTSTGGQTGSVGSGGSTSGSGGGSSTVVPDAGKPNSMMDAGKGDAAMHEDSSVSLPVGAEPGVSCGVGLPTLCELDTQKCCVRSLETDSCIAADATCDCALNGCTTMEARCDGPEDCATGQVCCGTLAGNGAGYDEFVCAASCQSNGNQRVACHGDETPCPSGMVCANSQLLTNVQVCIDPASIDQ